MSEEELCALDTNSYNYSLLRAKAFGKTEPSEKLELSVSEHDEKTLRELDVHNGDVIVVESNAYVTQLFENKLTISTTPAPLESLVKSKQIELSFLMLGENSFDHELHKLTAEERDTFKDIRLLALSCYTSENSSVFQTQIFFFRNRIIQLIRCFFFF